MRLREKKHQLGVITDNLDFIFRLEIEIDGTIEPRLSDSSGLKPACNLEKLNLISSNELFIACHQSQL